MAGDIFPFDAPFDGAPVDVLVAGAGMAGMAAAITAAEAGAAVLLVEKDQAVGGNARWAFGFDIEGPTLEIMRRSNPQGDPDLQAVLAAEFHTALAWLHDHGVTLAEDEPGRFNYAAGQGDGGLAAFSALRRALLAAGGTILAGAEFRSLLRDEAGRVNGAVIVADGHGHDVRAGAVVLATGGFGRNPAMKRRYLGGEADRSGYYGTQWHDGEGIRAGVEIGAGVTDGIAIPAGACVFPEPFAPPANSHRLGATDKRSAEVVPETIQALLIRPPVGASGALLLNCDGRRYVDESDRYSYVGWQTTRQRGATACCFFDREVADAFAGTLELALVHGALIRSAQTLDDLVNRLEEAEFGGQRIDRITMRATLEAFNHAAIAGAVDELDPPRREGAARLAKPPFYAVRIVQGVNDTAGGLAIDADARVRDVAGKVIHALYAAGADGGRPYSFEHGGLAHALVFGRIAGRNAAGFAHTRP